MFCFWISVSISFKSSLKLSGVILKKRLYSSSSSNRNSCNKVLSTPSLFLLVNHGLTHTVLNLFFFRFLLFLNKSYQYCCSTFFIRVHDKMRDKFGAFFQLIWCVDSFSLSNDLITQLIESIYMDSVDSFSLLYNWITQLIEPSLMTYLNR